MNNVNYFNIYENKYIYMKKSNSCCTLHSSSTKITPLRNSKTPYEIETYRHLGNSFPIANTSNHDFLIKAKMPIPSNTQYFNNNSNNAKPRYTNITKIKKPSDIAKEAITKIKTNRKQIYQNNSINNKLFYKSFNALTDDSSFEFNFNANDSFGNTNNSCIIMHNNNTTNIKVKHINNSKSCVNVLTNDKTISYVLNVLGIDNEEKDVFIRMQMKFKHLLNYSKKMLMRLGIGVIVANRIDNFNKEYKMFLKRKGKECKGSEREKVEMFFKENRKFIFDKHYKKNLTEGVCKESNKNNKKGNKDNEDGFIIESMNFCLNRTYVRKMNYNIRREIAAHKLYMKYKKVTKEVEMFLNKFHNSNNNHHHHYNQLKRNYVSNNSCNSSSFYNNNNNNNNNTNYSMRSIKLKPSLSSLSNKIHPSLSKNQTINSYSCLHFQK